MMFLPLNIFLKSIIVERFVDYPITPNAISTILEKLFSNYDMYSKGALEYYQSVDLIKIVKGILASI